MRISTTCPRSLSQIDGALLGHVGKVKWKRVQGGTTNEGPFDVIDANNCIVFRSLGTSLGNHVYLNMKMP